MYQYDSRDQQLVDQRVVEFREQTKRFLSQELSDDQFRPLRLMNGLYVERHAPMLRVAIPYGQLSSVQLRMLADIAREYDRGYGHITTRQNIQFNWPVMERVPDILASLATVQMHAIQSSGNCIRNITSDHLAGIDADEVEDPRPWCELIRQWSTLHPEFSYLPRKFKIAVIGTSKDRAATQVHDIGLRLVKHDEHGVGFEVLVGGGLGRTPVIGRIIRRFLPKEDLLSYLESILRVYNLLGRRDNKYKARIKILVRDMGIDAFRDRVEREWGTVRDSSLKVDPAEVADLAQRFSFPDYEFVDDRSAFVDKQKLDTRFANWVRQNTADHKIYGYRAVYISLKSVGKVPGDITADHMDAVAALAERFSQSAIRTTHTQNLLLPDVLEDELFTLWQALKRHDLATPNIATATDIICCPGLDFCSLANARSIPISQQIQHRLHELDTERDLGDIQIKISGCMNACAHHHVGHIGILGVDKKGEEWYQLTIGGSAAEDAALGERLGPAFAADKVADATGRLVEAYLELRSDVTESFLEVVKRVGVAPFREKAYV